MAPTDVTTREPLSLDLEEIARSRPSQGPHDWQDELDRRRQVEKDHAMRLRVAVLGLCPAARVVDREHLRLLATDSGGTHRPVVIRNRLVARGLVTIPVRQEDIGAWFQLDAATLRAWLMEELWWDPPAELLDGVHPEFRSIVVGAR